MKKILLLSVLVLIAFISGCDFNSNSLGSKLKVLRWGPDNAKIGDVPNKQPDGKMGIWIDVNSTEGLGELQVLFGGKPMPTAIHPKLVTAGVATENFSEVGEKKVEIQSMSTGESINVGNFKILP